MVHPDCCEPDTNALGWPNYETVLTSRGASCRPRRYLPGTYCSSTGATRVNPEGGGSEVYVERIAAELVRAGHRVTIFCAAHGTAPANETTAEGVRIVRRGGRQTVYLRAALIYLAGLSGSARWPRAGWAARTSSSTCATACRSSPAVRPPPGDRAGPPRPPGAVAGGLRPAARPVRLVDRVPAGGPGLPAMPVRDRLRGDPRRAADLGVDPERITVVHNGTPEVAGPRSPRTPHPAWSCSAGWCRTSGSRSPCARSPRWPASGPPGAVVAGQGWWGRDCGRWRPARASATGYAFAGFMHEDEKRRCWPAPGWR